MSKLARDHRNAELARIHIAIGELGWDDALYRSVLGSVFPGIDSAGKLDSAGRQHFLEHLKKCGWQPKRQATPPQGWQVKKIEDLWAKLGSIEGALQDPTPAALNTFVARMTNVSNPRFLDTRNAIKVTEALKAWIKRASAK